MNEQEKREKAIREMAKIDGDLSRCGEPPRILGKCKYESCPICRAERLYDAGYRKAEEVIKMTAKGFLQDFLRLCNMNGMTVEIVKKNLITMAEVIGVEIDEKK